MCNDIYVYKSYTPYIYLLGISFSSWATQTIEGPPQWHLHCLMEDMGGQQLGIHKTLSCKPVDGRILKF